MAEIKSIKKINIVDEVYVQLKEFIINGEWEPGSKIPSENELSTLFNVSRNTVRSAIQKLKAVGVLDTRQGQGTFVCESVIKNIVDSIMPIGFLSEEEIIEIMEFRKPLEVEAAGLAAIRRDEQDVISMQKALDAMVENLGDYKRHASADYQFHLSMAKASKNRMIYRALVKLKDVIYAHFEKMSKDLGTQMSIENHKRIFQAVKAKDPELARYIVKETIEVSINILKSK
jgi:DNA-binding FadR family transcriptional regulator